MEWLLWALFSTSMDASREEWEDEIVEYVAIVENVLGRAFPEGYNKDTPCMRLTLDPVPMLHRPLLWYLVGFRVWSSMVTYKALFFRSSASPIS